jgi:CBS domain-containing protein
MTLRNFFEEAVRCNVPGLPYVNEGGEIVGRLSIRDIYKHMAVPDNLLLVVDSLGDETDKLDLQEMDVFKEMARPVETYLLETIPSVSPRSSVVKALALMELHNSSYIFLIENGVYSGVVTRMLIAKRMLECVVQTEQERQSVTQQ